MSQTMKWVVADVVADMIVCAGYKEIGGDETRSIVMKAATDFLCTDSSSTDTSMLLCRWATEIVAALARMPFGLLPKLNAPQDLLGNTRAARSSSDGLDCRCDSPISSLTSILTHRV